MIFNAITPEYIAKVIIWHRKQSRINQITLAEMANVSRTAIQRIENGQNYTLENLLRVLTVLNLTLQIDGPLMLRFQEDR
jgi:transcriptional regulator with XRE-family HTH domain